MVGSQIPIVKTLAIIGTGIAGLGCAHFLHARYDLTLYEQYDYAGATAIGAVMLVLSFLILLAVNLLQGWTGRYREGN